MPITNIVVLLFILAMIYMGTVQGLFSSFLHLMVVIVAGTLAFALWEPLTLSLLIKYVPLFAWTLGLLVPFGVLLLVLRMVSDKLVPANAQFPGVMNLVLGGGCGLLSGMLTAGIFVIAIGFLPFTPNLGGYAPYTVAAGGVIQDTGSKLWVPVNSIAANFYGGLSRGAFSTKTPMALYKPELDVQMSLVRVRPDFISIVASPDAVKVTNAYIADTSNLVDSLTPDMAEVLGSRFNQPGAQLVIVDTEWSIVKFTADGDQAMRLPSSQVRLITRSKERGVKDVKTVGPIGFSKPMGSSGVRTFYPYDSGSQMAFSTAPNSTFGFVFLVEPGYEPQFPQIRLLRLDMPDQGQIKSNADEVLDALGQPKAPEPEAEEGDVNESADRPDRDQGATQISDADSILVGSYALALKETNRLPATASKNTISGLSVTDTDQGAMIVSGSQGSARKPGGNVGSRNKIVGFDIPAQKVMIQIQVKGEQTRSIFGSGIASAKALNPIFLEDSNGNVWRPTAWVWRKENGDQEIYFDDYKPVQSASQTPISQMGDDDEFYFYFSVTKPATLTAYRVGNESNQSFNPPYKVE